MWSHNFAAPKASDNAITIKTRHGNVKVEVHQAHVDMLKAFKLKGHNIIVWSQGGAEWAGEVVEALGLAPYVDAVMPKPDWYVDDLDINKWVNPGQRIYLEPKK